jgi:hypothetical protein
MAEDYWLDWANTCDHFGDYYDEIHQSLLVLQGAHLRPYRRARRGNDDIAAGADRRRPQLGLPLLLAPRRDATSIAMLNAGYSDEAIRWRSWLLRAVAGSPQVCRSCTASAASGASRSARSTGCRATRTHDR